MILLDWLQHKYIRKGETIITTSDGRNPSPVRVREIFGWGKYAAVMLEPVGAIRRDLIHRDIKGDWRYNYSDMGGE